MSLSNDDYFNASLYGPRDEQTSNFFMEKVQALQHYIPEQYQTLYEDIRNTAAHVNSDYLRDVTANLVSHVGSMWKGDVIRALKTTADLQAAPHVMQEYIMAQPSIRKMYHAQECDGYSDHYVDMEPGAIGEDHSTYRKVHHGVVHVADDGSESLTVYHSDMADEGYYDLTLANKVDIMTTWEAVQAAVDEHKADPTSTFLTYL